MSHRKRETEETEELATIPIWIQMIGHITFWLIILIVCGGFKAFNPKEKE